MRLRLKITLVLLGVVVSMACLGILAVNHYVDSREASSELEQLNAQRFLAQQARGDLEQVIALARREHQHQASDARQEFRSRAESLLSRLAELSDSAVESAAKDRFVILEDESRP